MIKKLLIVVTGIILGTAISLVFYGHKLTDVIIPQLNTFSAAFFEEGTPSKITAEQNNSADGLENTGNQGSTASVVESTIEEPQATEETQTNTAVTQTIESTQENTEAITTTAGIPDTATVLETQPVKTQAAVTTQGGSGSGLQAGHETQSDSPAKTGENSTGSLKLDAAGAVLIDEQTNEILYEKNSEDRMYPASTTKIMTALLAIENWRTGDVLTVGDEISRSASDASKAGLVRGEKITMGDLLKALLLPSGSDAAYVIAVHTARKASGDQNMSAGKAVNYFSDMMNERAKQLKATGTHFVNPDGYHDPDHYSTAGDIALITAQAMKKTYFREVVGTLDFTLNVQGDVDSKEKTASEIHLKNTNRLIRPGNEYYFKYATGVKTGYTDEAGCCLVSAAEKDGRSVVAVVLHSSEKGFWTDSIALLKYGLGLS